MWPAFCGQTLAAAVDSRAETVVESTRAPDGGRNVNLEMVLDRESPDGGMGNNQGACLGLRLAPEPDPFNLGDPENESY